MGHDVQKQRIIFFLAEILLTGNKSKSNVEEAEKKDVVELKLEFTFNLSAR
jgi:hypothetical protein